MTNSWVRRVWEREGFVGRVLWLCLLPLSCLYAVAVGVRNLCYAAGWSTSRVLERPVVSVGNLTVGGTGKTPTVLWLSQELAKRGLRVAVLTRGYKRKATDPVILEPATETGGVTVPAEEALAAGDEPAMMARIFGLRVGVGKKRYEAAGRLLQNSDVDVFILDDGYQHRQLRRDVDIVLLGAQADGWMLPAGPFRESKRSLRRADFYLLTGSEERWRSSIPEDREPASFRGCLEPKCLIGFEMNHWKEHPLSLMDRSRILTVAAIANREPFYRMIHDWEGEIVEALEFADHHHYSSQDWQRINRAARKVDLIVTTEKDIVKLIRFPFARDKLLALRVTMVVENGEALISAVADRIQKGRFER